MSPRIGQIEIQPFRGLVGAFEASIELRNGNERLIVQDAQLRVSMTHETTGGEFDLAQGRMRYPDRALEVGRASDSNLSFVVNLSSEQIRRIEDIRRGGRLSLKFTVVLLGFNADASNAPVRLQIERAMQVDKARWVEDFLPSFGLGRRELWEVDFPKVPEHDSLESEYRSLQQAVRDYDRGEYEDAFRDCRSIIESLRKRSEELQLEKFVGREEWNRASNYLSIALHSEREIQRKILRADAEFAIQVTRAALNRISSALAHGKKSE